MSNIPTTIKSSSLDFNSLKSNLKTYLQNTQEFTDYDFEASGLSNILDVLAHNTHINGLITNFALNESYLGTAQLRSSAISLSEGIGYVPDSATASLAKIRIYYNTSTTPRESPVTLPAYTKFNTTVEDTSYSFMTIEPFVATDDGNGFYEFKTNLGVNEISIYEGTLKTKTFLVGEYQDNPVYVIPDTGLFADSVTVRVYPDATSSEFTDYTNILNTTSINASSKIYILRESPNGFFDLSFGDGNTFGISPPSGAKIEVIYLSTSGPAANGANRFTPGQQFTTGGDNSITVDLITSTLQRSVGGKEKESIDSIRKNAPFSYASQNRMVTAADYSALILKNYSSLIKDIISWGGEDAAEPEYGAVFTSILFEDGIGAATVSSVKQGITNLAEQLAVASFNLRFADPITTFIEVDTYFQFNPTKTDKTSNTVRDEVNTAIVNYFGETTGVFNSSFRRSNMLSLVDDVNTAVLSSRADVRMQRRFTPTNPQLIAVINIITDTGSLTGAELDYVINLINSRNYNGAANYLLDFSSQNFTSIKTTLASTSISNIQQIDFPVPLAAADNDQYIITSNTFVYKGKNCQLRNRLNSNIINIIDAGSGLNVEEGVGVWQDNRVTINYFNPSTVSGTDTQIALSAVPANTSAITPTRNDLLVYDPNRSSVNAVLVTAEN
jgi:hypothetical protein